jgi:hypothetical protein
VEKLNCGYFIIYSGKLFQIINLKPNPRKIDHYLTIINKISHIEDCPEIA